MFDLRQLRHSVPNPDYSRNKMPTDMDMSDITVNEASIRAVSNMISNYSPPPVIGNKSRRPKETRWFCSDALGDFGDKAGASTDIITALEFNIDGNFLAMGDRGGRVVIFEKEDAACYTGLTTYEAYKTEFDYLKSVDVEPKVNKIKWLNRQTSLADFLLTTNDRVVKLWKIGGKENLKLKGFNFINGNKGSSSNEMTTDENDQIPAKIARLSVPNVVTKKFKIASTLRKTFSDINTYSIHSLSLNSDEENFMTGDDLRINLWNLDSSHQGFNIVNWKPEKMEDLSELITSSEFHPESCNLFVYGSTQGKLRLCDMRVKALCDEHAKLFNGREAHQSLHRDESSTDSFFAELVALILDVKFSPSGRYLMSRDYYYIHIWDLNMESKPIETYNVQEFLRPSLEKLYESNNLFDKFSCTWSHDERTILTGSYNDYFRVFDRTINKDYTFEAIKRVARSRQALKSMKLGRANGEVNENNVDFSKKILCHTMHPQENMLAVAARDNLYFFTQKVKKEASTFRATIQTVPMDTD